MDVAIRCTTPNCSCDCFAPGKSHLRICESCSHGWISHAMDKVSFRHLINNHNLVENIQSNGAFDLASLVLYGTHALPVRLKILLDRVLCTLHQDELLHLLHGFGWTFEDYSRGYMIQDTSGNVRSKWSIVTKDEETLIFQHFLRFVETKNIAQSFLLQDSAAIEQINSNSAICFAKKKESDIRKFIERANKNTNLPNYKSANSNSQATTNSASPSSTASGKSGRKIQTSILHPSSPGDQNEASTNNSRSPLSMSPLNKLQNMQPFDFRKSDLSGAMPPTTSSSLETQTSYGHTITSSSPLYNSASNMQFLSSGHSINMTTPITNHVSSLSTNMTTSTSNSDLSATDGGSDDDTNLSGVINLSQASSAYALKKVKHLRKSANPMKRKWNPMVLSNLNTNPSTGKKRVQCHVCLKTFCDKGALKIHFSAVHLREMHKCTVEGCNMMFSSRRSRNRHSANPNPKLHTPNFRRKINPHDGRSANPYPLIPPSASSTLLNLTGNSFIGQAMNANVMTDSEQMNEFGHLASSSSLKSGFDQASSTGSRSPIDCRTPELESELFNTSNNKKLKTHEKEPTGELDFSHSKNGPPEEGMNLSLKDEKTANRGVRKRKSLNPIKCAPVAVSASDDDDIRYISSEDSSSDTFIDQQDDDNGLLDDSKSDEDDSSDNCQNDLKNDYNNLYFKEKNRKLNDRMKKEELEYQKDGTIDLSKKSSSTPEKKHDVRTDASSASKNSAESAMENPLRHLESLSLGAFTSLVPPRNQRGGLFASTSAHPLPFQAPGLGMCLKPPTPPPQINQPSSERETNLLITKDSDSGGVNSLTVNANSVPSGLDIDSRDQASFMFRDSPFVGQIEVPVDKENPRRCTACGKIFQNHFGVKTHYQNVHLKLMHKCTVEGCNASFPSKRSRDRHSANLNLHRKLLSTHSDGKSGFGLDKAATSALFPFHPGAALRDDFISRLYDPQGLPLSLTELYSRLPPLGPDGLFASAAAAAAAAYPVGMPGFHPSMCLPPPPPMPPNTGSLFLDTRSNLGRDTPSSIGTSPTPSPSPSNRSSPHKIHQSHSPQLSLVLEASFNPSEEGKYNCTICQKCFSNEKTIKEHYEMAHFDALFRCCVQGCNKAFLSKKSKKHHIQMHSPGQRERSP